MPAAPGNERWKLLIVDDEEEIHVVTRLVLRDFVFDGKRLEFLEARSAAEAIQIFESGEEIAVVLLDVVMETDRAGLDVVRHIRGKLGNRLTRIVLRTGQPGSAPERSVISEYDINDYKEKSELTSVKLYSCVMTALRSWLDLVTIDKAKRGLEKIIDSSATLFRTEASLSSFVSAILRELDALLRTSRSFFYVSHEGFAAVGSEGSVVVVSGTGEFEGYLDRSLADIERGRVRELVERAMAERTSLYLDKEYVGYFVSRHGYESILYMRTTEPMAELEKNLLHVFSTSIALAFDNLVLNKDIVDTQKEIVYTVGDIVETRSRETANHVKRVAEFSLALGRLAGLGEEDCALLYNAAPMHDLGKIGIPDGTMLKPGTLDPQEWETMKQHTVIGYDILKNSKREILKAACVIAHQHHERWDGTGYPAGLAGESIHVFARILAIADVFDALSHKRSYKDPWPIDRVRDYIEEGAGSQFDPSLVRIFIANFAKFVAIMKSHPDRSA